MTKFDLNRESLIKLMRGLTPKQFAELFYEVVDGMHPWPYEKSCEGRYVLVGASRYTNEEDSVWELKVICPAIEKNYADDATLCQHGNHCGQETTSWSKHSVCPLCNGEVYGT